MFLFDSNLASRDWPSLERHVEDVLRKHSGEIVYSERWPDRRMAYEIRGCKKGTYYLTYFNAPPGAIAGLRRDCELSDRILRVLFLQEEGIEEELERRKNRQTVDAAEGEERPRARSARDGESSDDEEGERPRTRRRAEEEKESESD